MSREEALPPISLAAVAVGIFGLASYFNQDQIAESSQTKPKPSKAQRHEKQIIRQLEVGSRVIAKLSVNSRTKEYTFTTQAPPESVICEGDYNVINNQARIAEDMACITAKLAFTPGTE